MCVGVVFNLSPSFFVFILVTEKRDRERKGEKRKNKQEGKDIARRCSAMAHLFSLSLYSCLRSIYVYMFRLSACLDALDSAQGRFVVCIYCICQAYSRLGVFLSKRETREVDVTVHHSSPPLQTKSLAQHMLRHQQQEMHDDRVLYVFVCVRL